MPDAPADRRGAAWAPEPVSLSGTVVAVDDRLVGRVLVSVVSAATRASAEPIGVTLTDERGRFEIGLPPELGATPRVRISVHDPAQPNRDESARRGEETLPTALHTTDAITVDSHEPMRIEIPMPERKPTERAWKRVAEQAAESRIGRVDLLVRGLLDGTHAGPFPGLALAERVAMVATIERSFLDPSGELHDAGVAPTFRTLDAPTGSIDLQRRLSGSAAEWAESAVAKVAAFDDIFAVDWAFDIESLGRAEVGSAMGRFEGAYAGVLGPFVRGQLGLADRIGRVPGGVIAPDGSFAPDGHPTSELSRYRDYLLAIFCGPASSASFGEWRKKLADRFHQTFAGNDITPRPANKLLHDIVRKILIAPRNAGYGFARPSTGIPQQGELTDREHLDALVAHSGISTDEFSRRYRLDLGRSDAAMSSIVEEQIATLQRFFTDGFQSAADPFPIIPNHFLGKPPFFLYFDEWRRREGAFHAENFISLAGTIGTVLPVQERAGLLATDLGSVHSIEQWKHWFVRLLRAEDLVAEGVTRLRQQQYVLAADRFERAALECRSAIHVLLQQEGVSQTLATINARMSSLRNQRLDSTGAVSNFERMHHPPRFNPIGQPPSSNFNEWWAKWQHVARFSLCHLAFVVLPTMRGDAALASGDFAGAVRHYELTTRFLLPRAAPDADTAWRNHNSVAIRSIPDGMQALSSPRVHSVEGSIPYAAVPHRAGDDGLASAFDEGFAAPNPVPERDPEAIRMAILAGANRAVGRLMRLRHAEALLTWADALHRSEEPSNAQRAREIYKAVLMLHGIAPGIAPRWNGVSVGASNQPSGGGGGGGGAGNAHGATLAQNVPAGVLDSLRLVARPGGRAISEVVSHAASPIFIDVGFFAAAVNPALASQLGRARMALAQLHAGLNFHGMSDGVVPTLRYSVLKDAADRFTTSARSAQEDFLRYMGKLEDALHDEITHSNMLRRAELQGRIAAEQAGIAAIAVSHAHAQVKQVEKAIEEKRKELAESRSFFNQLTSFLGGMVTAITDLPGPSSFKADVGNAALAGYGLKGSEGAAFSGAAAGAAGLAGYGLFVYAGYTSLSRMAEEHSSLTAQIKALETEALPMARDQVRIREAEQRIVNLQWQIADADAQYARDLMHFQVMRFLNVEMWAALSAVAKRLLRRYLAMGARFAWLAERALAFDQDRPIDIIRMDYFPHRMQGVGGADVLRADLAELEVARLDGIRRQLPIRRTLSLAFEQPGAFAMLKATGRCTFHTSEQPFRMAHPGVWGVRVVSVVVGFAGARPLAPVHGLLTHEGVSLISDERGDTTTIVRAAEAAALSEHDAQRDAELHGLPGEALSAFEGSGVEALWTLEVPPSANPEGLDKLVDVQIVVDARAHHSMALRAKHLAEAPKRISRVVFLPLSATASGAKALEALREGDLTAPAEWTLGGGALPSWHKNAEITNVVISVSCTADAPPITGTLSAVDGPSTAPFTIEDGVVLTQLPPLVETAGPPSPLDVLVGTSLPSVFQFAIESVDGHPEVIEDLVLGIEYEADLVE